MEGTRAAADVPIQMPHQHGRLILLVGGFVLLIATSWWWLFASLQNTPMPGNPFFGWRVAIPAVTIAGLLMFAVVTALMDLRQRVRWLVVFGILMAESLLLTTGELVLGADYRWENLLRLVSWQGPVVMHLTLGLGTVLAVHTFLWPIRALLGWQVHWAGEPPRRRERLLTIWHLVGWVALMGVLVMAAGSSMLMALFIILLAELGSLLVMLPVLILCTRRKRLPFWIAGVLVALIGFSYVEDWLTFFASSAAGSGGGIPVWFIGIWNAVVAGATLIAVFLLRWTGLEFHLPMSLREAALRRSQTAGLAASSGAREFQFSLRSLLILTTLLCIGPGAYIGWEREQCRRGSDLLARVEKAGGKAEPNYHPRPAWLRVVMGDNAFRHVESVTFPTNSSPDTDLAQLSGLPNLVQLMLDKTHTTDAGLASLSDLKNLRGLTLTKTPITDEGLVHLSRLKQLSNLSLNDTKVTSAGLVSLSELTNLRTLRLQNMGISEGGLIHLSPLVNLDWLFVDNTDIGDEDLQHLPPNLKWVGLSGTKVTDAGLASLSHLTQLDNLRLSDTAITDAGLVHLGGLTKLKTLVVKNTQVTAEGAAKLNEKLPGVKIHR